MKDEELLYLYCVADKAPDLTEVRGRTRGPFVVPHEGLYAVAGKVPREDFEQESLKRHLTDLDWVRARVVAHEQVLEAAMASSCVVPFKFATLFNNEDNLKGMLAQNAPLLKETLQALEGHQEWGLKVYCDAGMLRASLAQDLEVSRLGDEIASSSPGKAFILRKRQEARLDQMLSAKADDCCQASFSRLGALCSKARLNRVSPEHAAGRRDSMVLNAAFLIQTAAVKTFIATVDMLQQRHRADGLSFDRTGPWPPYNFCDRSGRPD